MIFFMFFISALLIILLSQFLEKEEANYPLIIVNGKVAPRLSPIFFHTEKSSESECVNCHMSPREILYKEKIFVPSKIPHERRENCKTCHVLEL